MIIHASWILFVLLSSMMSLPSLRQRLLQGHKSYGPLLLSDSPIVAEVLALAGYDHIVVDHEHAPTDIRSGQAMLQAIQAAQANTEPIVRLPGHDPIYMKKVLDSLRLPGGVLVPMVEDVETAQAVVQSTRYPTQQNDDQRNAIGGIRGCGAPFVRGSGWGYNEDYMGQCQEDLLVMVQVETVSGVEAIADIAQVQGIDAIFLGPLDLSCSIGKLGQFHDAHVSELISKAEQAVVRESSCLLAGFRSPGRGLKDMFSAGYSFVCGSVDLGMLKQAARLDVEEWNASRND